MVALFLWVGVAGGIVAHSYDVAEGGHDVPEGYLGVAAAAGSDMAGPAHDEGYSYAAFVGLALEAAQQSVAVEEGGVGAAFLGILYIGTL